MSYLFETRRLGLRRFSEDDLEKVHELGSDPDVMRHITGRALSREESGQALARAIAQYDGWKVYGNWAAELKANREFIGNFALRPLSGVPSVEAIELGYRIRKSMWRMGFASEGARFLVDYAFTTLRLQKIVAIVTPDNDASQKVLASLGFDFESEVEFRDPTSGATEPVRLFSIFSSGCPGGSVPSAQEADIR